MDVKHARGEYRILSASHDAVQKTLNQWQHMYDLSVLSCCHNGGITTMTVYRKPIGKDTA